MIADISANERAFIGCLLRSPHEFHAVSEVVTADCLDVQHHRDIYTAIRDLSERGRPITITALQSVLPEEYDGHGPTVAILMALRENHNEAGSATDYAPFLAERSALKRLDSLSTWLRKETGKNERPSEDIAAEAAVRLQSIMATANPVKPVKLADVTKRIVKVSTLARDKDVMPGYTTGILGLDEMVGLIMGGDLIGVLGALGDGKSALVTQIGKHIARRGPVLAANNEMGEEQNATRALAAASGMSVREVREGSYDFDGIQALKDAQAEIEKLNYHLYTDPRMTVRSIAVRARQMKQTMGLAAITIDGAKRLRLDQKVKDYWERKEEITGQLKELALELRVPVIAAFQRTRTARRRDDAIPQLDDADFPTLETDADTVLGIWREESWLMMNKPNPKAGGEAWEQWEHKVRAAKGIAKIIALKLRSGKPFEQREFKWDGPTMTIKDLGT